MDIRYNKIEEKDRKHWLFLTYCYFVILPIFLSVFFAIQSQFFQISKDVPYKFLEYAGSGLIQLWMIWYCAYRKHGTKLLTLWMMFGSMRTLLSTLKLLDGSSNNPWIVGATFLDILIYVWWHILSLRMRKINKRIQSMRIQVRYE